MRKRKPCFLVLESYWSEDLAQRESVLPFVKGLCDLNLWDFHYRTFDSSNDLKLWIRNFDKIRRSGADKIVYLATHGSTAGRLWTLEEKIPIRSLAAALGPARSITGLHLGSCNLGRPRILEALITKTPLHWVAGYDQEVPWLESTCLDLLFWSWIYAGAPRAVRSRKLTPEGAAHELYSHFHYSRQMGFRVLSRSAEGEEHTSSWESWKDS